MNVRYLINRAVKEYPDSIAVVYKNIRKTFSEVNTRVNCLVNGLFKLGIKSCCSWEVNFC